MQAQHSKQYGYLFVVLVVLVSLLGMPASPASADAQASVNFIPKAVPTPITTTTRVSVDSSGVQGNGYSSSASISADGRYVAFESYAINLVSGDTNDFSDIFVRDTQTGTTKRVSVDSSGLQGNDYSYSPSISADGRYVAFQSDASNLVSEDTNNKTDVFLRDTQLDITRRLSVDPSGAQANNSSYSPSISEDGHYVAFYSDATNLVSEDTNSKTDVFLRDTQLDITRRLSLDSSGIQGNSYSYSPSISEDGRYVAFHSDASNLVSGDTNSNTDVFVRDTQMSTTIRVSLDSSGVQGNSSSFSPSISEDGRYVAFQSYAINLVSGDTNGNTDIFVRDTQTNTTTRISVDSSGLQGNDQSSSPSISSDGRYVAFWSYASNLVSGDTNSSADIFVRDTQTSTTARLSVDSSGAQANNSSYSPSISADGPYVTFESSASNLVSGDTNNRSDIFVVPATVYNLTLNITGPGSGMVTNSPVNPAGISCGSVCSGTFVSGTTFNLVALPATGADQFTGWSGDISGTDNPVAVTVNSNMHITANFIRASTTYTISGNVQVSGVTLGFTDGIPRMKVASGSDGSYSIIVPGGWSGTIVPSRQGYIFSPVNRPYSNIQADTVNQNYTAALTTIIRVSVDSSGAEGSGDPDVHDRGSVPTHPLSISGDGSAVAFFSSASNLVSGDANGFEDVFVHNAQTGITTLVSVDSSGVQGNNSSQFPSISADGRFVAFVSSASNLVSGDTNGMDDIFVHAIQTGITTRVSVDSSGVQGNGYSSSPFISADGRYVAFASGANNLVSGDTNIYFDIFVHDTQTGATKRVSVDSSGAQGNNWSDAPSISADGRYVAFASGADNLVGVDTNNYGDIFVHDTQTGATTLVSVDSSGVQGNKSSVPATISGNGRYVAFWSYASNLVTGDTNNLYDAFVHDTLTGTTTRVSVDSNGTQANENWWYWSDSVITCAPSISADGRYIAFNSYSDNLVSDDTNWQWDVFVHDTQTGITARLSVDSSGMQGDEESFYPSISADGHFVAFYSIADNLVSDDTNGQFDYFITPATLLNLSVSKPGTGSGTVVGTSSPAGITCGSVCSAIFLSGTTISLAATPDTGSAFTGWSGSGCSGTGTCTITMDVDKSVTAAFAPKPILTSIFPMSALAGGPAYSLTVTGTNFDVSSIIRWNGADRATSFVSSTQLTTTIPATDITSTGVGYISVFNPSPGGGASNSQAFYITLTSTVVTASNTASGTDPSATTGSSGITASATGSGTLSVAEFASNPGGATSFNSAGAFVDLHLKAGNTFTSLTVEDCDLNGGNQVYWWNGSTWAPASTQTYNPVTHCVILTVNGSTSPSLIDLTGTPFGAAIIHNLYLPLVTR